MIKKLLVAGAVLTATPIAAQVSPNAPEGAPRGQWGGTQARADVTPRVQQLFAMLDANHDGVIDQAEIATVEARMQGQAGAGEGRGPRGMGRIQRMLAMADTNGDGRITLQEATDGALKQFDAADLNHDGQLTPDERQAARARMQGQQ